MYWTVWIPAWLCRYRIICLPACLIAFCMLSVYLHLQTWPSVWIWYLALSLILPAWHQYEHALVSSYMYLTICLYMSDCLYYCILIVCMPVCMSAFADLDCMSDFDISPYFACLWRQHDYCWPNQIPGKDKSVKQQDIITNNVHTVM